MLLFSEDSICIYAQYLDQMDLAVVDIFRRLPMEDYKRGVVIIDTYNVVCPLAVFPDRTPFTFIGT